MKTLLLNKNERYIFKNLAYQIDTLWNQIAMYLATQPNASFKNLLDTQNRVKSSYDMTLNDQILNANTHYEWMLYLKMGSLPIIHNDMHRSCVIIPKFTFLNQMLGNTLSSKSIKHQYFMLMINDKNMSSIKIEPLLY